MRRGGFSLIKRDYYSEHILLKIAALRNNNGLKRAALEIGKAERTNFLLRVSIDRNMGGEIQRECLKSERWHEFGKDIFIGR